MTAVHPNVALLERFAQMIPKDLVNAKPLFSDDFVWHYFNPALPEVAGDYEGFAGPPSFLPEAGCAN